MTKVTRYIQDTASNSAGYTKTSLPTSYGVSTGDYLKKVSSQATSQPSDYMQTRSDYYQFDSAGYRQAQLDWMNGDAAFDGWTDQDKNSFLDSVQTNRWTANQANAAQIWQNWQIGIRNSNEQKKKDRADILAEIEAYKAGYSNEAISTALAQERQALDIKIEQTMQQAVNQAAAQGRVMDNTTYAMLRGRLEAQAASVLQQAQMGYEQKRQEYALQAMQMKNDVYKNSGDTMMGADDVTNIIKAMAGK